MKRYVMMPTMFNIVFGGSRGGSVGLLEPQTPPSFS